MIQPKTGKRPESTKNDNIAIESSSAEIRTHDFQRAIGSKGKYTTFEAT